MNPEKALDFFQKELESLLGHRQVLQRADNKGTPTLDRKIAAHEAAIEALKNASAKPESNS